MNIKELHEKLNRYLDNQKRLWKRLAYADGEYYQSLKEVGIEGKRSTEQRFEEYKIRNYLGKDKEVLDIGANTGFFSIYISPFVKNCDCVEFNPHLVKIGREVAQFLNRKVTFHVMNFKDFKTEKKYDIILSFAADEVSDRLNNLEFENYIDKIISMLKEDGKIFFEAQARDMVGNRFEPKLNYLKKRFDIILKKEINSDYPKNIPKRIFLIGTKR